MPSPECTCHTSVYCEGARSLRLLLAGAGDDSPFVATSRTMLARPSTYGARSAAMLGSQNPTETNPDLARRAVPPQLAAAHTTWRRKNAPPPARAMRFGAAAPHSAHKLPWRSAITGNNQILTGGGLAYVYGGFHVRRRV